MIQRKSYGVVLFFSSSELVVAASRGVGEINSDKIGNSECGLTLKLIDLPLLIIKEITISKVELSFNVVFSFFRINAPSISYKSMLRY